MTVDADDAARAVTATWEGLFELLQVGWFERREGAVAGVTGIPIAMFNGVWAEATAPAAATVGQLLDRVRASDLPCCAQLRPGTPDDVIAEVAGRGLLLVTDMPLMVLEDAGRLARAQQVEGLAVRRLPPEELPVHLGLVSDAFGLDKAVFAEVFTPETLERPEVRCYVGESRGEAVTTGLGVRLRDFIGVFNIATAVEKRRRGFAAAVTARIVADGVRDGAGWAWLQSSPAGYGVYEALGFETRERWDCWVTPPSP